MLPIFITGNQNKADYLSEMLGIDLQHEKLELDEVQSADPFVVTEHKVRQAYAIIQKPILIQDTSLIFNALNGLPGPFVKFFVEAENGLDNLCRMLNDFDDRSAYALVIYGYYDGQDISYVSGRLDGTISTQPRGDGGYGWDRIFEPEGYGGLTRAELSPDLDIETYNKLHNFEKLQNLLKSMKTLI